MSDVDDKITISASMLKELELQLLEDKKRLEQHLRVIALLRGGFRERPVTVPLSSPTGRTSKCVELAKQSFNRQIRKSK